ncbi:hypothetical protein LTR17_001296 [Elasticomyces elasticus]|nr:hypothetical protein LTR17_001296 [Elasticomyces elasticus]
MVFTPRGPMSENFWQPPTSLQGSAHDLLPQDLVAGHEGQRPDLRRPMEASRALNVVIGDSTNKPKSKCSTKGKLEDAVQSLKSRPRSLSSGLWADDDGAVSGRATWKMDKIERHWDEWEQDRETPYLPWSDVHPDGSRDRLPAEASQGEMTDATTELPRDGKVSDSGFWGTIRKALTQVIDDMTVPFPGSPPLPTPPPTSSSTPHGHPSLAQSFTQALDDMSFTSPGELVTDEVLNGGGISPLMLSERLEGRRGGEEKDGFVLFECVERGWEGIGNTENDFEMDVTQCEEQQGDDQTDMVAGDAFPSQTGHDLVCIDHGTSWHADTQAVVGVGHGIDTCMLHSAEARRIAEDLPETTLAKTPTVRVWDPTAELSAGCRIGKVYLAVTQGVSRFLLPAFDTRHDSATLDFDGYASEWEDESASGSDREVDEGSGSYRKLLGEFRTAHDSFDAQNSCMVMSARAHAEPDPEILVSLPMPLNMLFRPFRTPSCHNEMRADPFPPLLPLNEMPPENFQLSDKPRAVQAFEQDVTTPPTSPLDMRADPPPSLLPEHEMPRAEFQLKDKPQPVRGLNQDLMEHLLESYHATQQLGMPPGRGPTIAERMRYTFFQMSDEKRAIYISRMNQNGLWALYDRLNEFEHEDAQAREDYKQWTHEHTWGGQLQRDTSAEYLEAQRSKVFAEKARIGRLRSPPPYIDLVVANPDEQEEYEQDDDEEYEQDDDEEYEQEDDEEDESPSPSREQKRGDENGVVITETELAEDDDEPVESLSGGAGQVTSRDTHSPPHAGVDEARRRIDELMRTAKTQSPSDSPVQRKTPPPPVDPRPSVDREKTKEIIAELFKAPSPSKSPGRPKSPIPTRSPIVPYKLKRTKSLSEDRSPEHQNYDQTGRFPDGFIAPLPSQPAAELGRPPTPEPLDLLSDKSPSTPARKVSGARNISPLPASPSPLRQVEVARYDDPPPQAVEMEGAKRVQRFDGFELPPKRQAQEPSPTPDVPASLPPPYDEMMDDSGGAEHVELAGPTPSLPDPFRSSALAQHGTAQSNALAESVAFTGQTHSIAGPSRQRSTPHDDSVEQVVAGPSRQRSAHHDDSGKQVVAGPSRQQPMLQDGSIEQLMLDAHVEVLDGVPFSEDPQDEMFGDAEPMGTAQQAASTSDVVNTKAHAEEAIEDIQTSDNTSLSEVPDLRSKPREMDTTLRATPEEEPVDEDSPEARLQREREQSVSDLDALAAPGSAQPQDASMSGDVHPDLQGEKAEVIPATSQSAESKDTSTAEVADSRSGGNTPGASTSASEQPQDTTVSEDSTSQQHNEEGGASTEPSPALTAFRFPLKPDNAESATAGDGASILSRSTTGSQRSRHRRTGASDFSLNNGSWKFERTHSAASIGISDMQAIANWKKQGPSTSPEHEGPLQDVSNEQSTNTLSQSTSPTASLPETGDSVSLNPVVTKGRTIEKPSKRGSQTPQMVSPISASAALAALKAKENLTPESRRTQLLSVDDELSVEDLANIQGANQQARNEAQKLANDVQLGRDSVENAGPETEENLVQEDATRKSVNVFNKVKIATERGLERVSKDVRAAVRRRSKSRSVDLPPELKMTSGNADELEEKVRRSYGKHIHLPGIGRRITSGKHPDPFHDQHAVSEGGMSDRRRSSAQPSTPDPFDDRHAVPEDGKSDKSDGDVDNDERPLLHTPKSPSAKSPSPGKSILKVKQHTPEESQPPANIEEPPSPTFRSKGKQRAVDPPHSPAISARDPRLRLISPGQLTEEHINISQMQDQSPEELAKSKQDADEQLIECVEQYGGDVLQVPEHVHAALPAWSRAMLSLERTHRRQQEENEELKMCIQQYGGDIMQVPDEAVTGFSERVQTLFHDERCARRLQQEEDANRGNEERQVSVEDNEAYARRLQEEEDERARQEEENESMAEMQRQAAEPGEGMSALERWPTRRERASSSTQAAPAESPEERRRTSDLQLAADERIIEETPELRERRNWLDKGGDPQWPDSDDDRLSPTSKPVSPYAQAPPESQASQPSVGRAQGTAEHVSPHTQAPPTREAPTSGPNFPHAASPAPTSLAEQLKRVDLRDRPASSGESHQQATSSQSGPGPSSSSTIEKPKRKAAYDFKSLGGKIYGQAAPAAQQSSTAASTSAAVTAPSVPDERPSAPAATDSSRQSSVAQQQNSTAASEPGPVLPPIATEAAASTTSATPGNDQTEAPPIPPRHPRRAQPNPEDQNGDASRSRRGSDGVDSELGEGDSE